MRIKQFFRKVIPFIVLSVLVFSTVKIISTLEGLKDKEDYTQILFSAVNFEVTFALGLFVYLQTERYNAFQRSLCQPILCISEYSGYPCSDTLGVIYNDGQGIKISKSFAAESRLFLSAKLRCSENGRSENAARFNLQLCFRQRCISSFDNIGIRLEWIPQNPLKSAGRSLPIRFYCRPKMANNIWSWHIKGHPIFHFFEENKPFIWQFYFYGLPEADLADCRTIIIRLNLTLTDTASYTHRLKYECIYEVFNGKPMLATVRSR